MTIETIDSIPNDTLVTFVGMVQDMFNPEYFVSEYTDATGAWRTTRYGDKPVDIGCEEGGDGLDARDGCSAGSCAERRFDERHPVLVVPVPGQSDWVRERVREAAMVSMTNFRGPGSMSGKHDVGGPGASKRQLEGVSMEIDEGDRQGNEATRPMGSVGGSVGEVGVAKKAVMLDASAGKQQTTDKEKLNSTRDIPPGSCVIHFYHGNAVKLNEVVQVLGIISRVPELASGAMHGIEDEDEGTLASRIPTSVAPRIHAISVRKLDVSGVLSPSNTTLSLESSGLGIGTREQIVRYLTDVLEGDSLAAEYVLMQLVSRVHRRTQGGAGLIGGHGQDTHAQLGMAALNITGISGDERTDSATTSGSSGRASLFASHLGKALSLLMPSVVTLPLDINALNKQPWYPTKVNDNKSHEAALQLPGGTVVVLDETAMTAGQLTETGLKNLGAIQTMMKSQVLPYDFQFYQLEQPTDQPIIIVSMGRTMLKGAGEIQVALARTGISTLDTNRHDMSYGGDVGAARRYITTVRSMAFSIPQDLEKQIENDMTEARKKDSTNVTAETFHSWLNLARLLCLSHGESVLSVERWQQVLAMEAERVKRIALK